VADDAVTAVGLDLRAGLLGWHPVEDMSFTLDELAQATGGTLVDTPAEVVLDRLVTDSRQAGPGALFVALVGEAMDGHDFIPTAVAAGASALLCQRVPDGVSTPRVIVPDTREALVAFSRDRLRRCAVGVVGVTGSAGKTTTKEMIAAVLARRLKVHKTEGNLNTYTGLPMTLAHLEKDHQVFVAEYGMSARGEIAFLARMAPPDIAVVLNVGLAHVGLLGGVEEVAAAKRELVEALPAAGIAVLNADDERVAAMAPAVRGRVVYYGVRDPGDLGDPGRVAYFASDVRLHGLAGTTFILHAPGGTVEVMLAVPGVHAVSNAVAAAAVGDLNGVPLDEAAVALAGFRPVGGRLNLRPGRGGSLVIDDAYNASPGSMEASLQVLRSEPGRRRIAVLGDMLELGDEAAAAHRRVGTVAAGCADLLVALGEQAGVLVAAARAAGMALDRALAVDDVDHALMAIEPELPGSLVLVKGSRGMALDRIVDRLVEA
jgi:UDP-N-acetylmuramoyl-tripeptide--D-alanyl-D-alanine ligase